MHAYDQVQFYATVVSTIYNCNAQISKYLFIPIKTNATADTNILSYNLRTMHFSI